MNKKEDRVRDVFIETMGNLGEGLGLNRTVCQMYALLYLSPQPLSPTEISAVLGVSKGNVSINMRKLETWNAVRRVWRKGYARSLYCANEDVEEIVLDKLKSGVEKRIVLLKKNLRGLSRETKTSPYAPKIAELKRILDKMESFTRNFALIKSLLK